MFTLTMRKIHIYYPVTIKINTIHDAIAIFINVQGGEAPWQCLAYRDGTIGDIMYTGSEGAM